MESAGRKTCSIPEQDRLAALEERVANLEETNRVLWMTLRAVCGQVYVEVERALDLPPTKRVPK